MTYRPEACSNSLRPLIGFCRSGDEYGQGRSNPVLNNLETTNTNRIWSSAYQIVYQWPVLANDSAAATC